MVLDISEPRVLNLSVSAPLLVFSFLWCKKLFINFFGRSVSAWEVLPFLWYLGWQSLILEFTLEPTIEITFLGLGSIRFLSWYFFDYYETSVVVTERFVLEG